MNIFNKLLFYFQYLFFSHSITQYVYIFLQIYGSFENTNSL